MEMPPDTLETVGVNELFVAVGVEVSLTTEETHNKAELFKKIAS